MNRPLLWLILVLFPTLGAPVQACSPDELFALVGERLSLMPAVAAYKFQHGLPVTDEAREQQVEAATVNQARVVGIDPARVLPLIRAQMEAAKVIQRKLIQQWTRQGGRSTIGPGESTDLIASIRPRLIELGNRQLEAIRCLRERGLRVDPGDRQSFNRVITAANLPRETADELFYSLVLIGG